MGKRSQTTRKQLSILLILCMVATLPIVSAPAFAAEDNGVKVTHVPSMLWGGLGQYVEYEMDGIKYRTDEASSANNRLAWSRMTQEQRRQTYDRLHTTAARKAAFGEDGFADIVSWIRETNEWFVANRLWKDRIANRDFPELHSVYNESASLSTLYSDYEQLALYVVPQNVARHLAREKFDKALADVNQTYEIGRQYYQKMVDMRGKNIGAVASFTMMQCTQMLSDMLFVPSVVQGATAATSGMIADVTNVLLQVIKLDGGSIAEKVESAMAGHSVQLSLAEQIKLREAVIETYKRLAERCKNELGPKMSDLRFEQKQLQELSEQIARSAQQLAAEREQAKEDYQTRLEGIFISPPPKQLGEGDGIYITLAFKWKTESELRRDLFNNDFETWRAEKKTEADDSGYLAAAEAIFDEVLAQKAVLDQEVMGKVSQISEQLMEAYNKVNDKLEALEEEADRLEHKADSDLPEDEVELTRIPVGATYFYGTEAFAPELENFAYSGRPYDDYYGELQSHISDYQAKVDALLEAVNALKDGHEGFNSSIATDVEDVAYYLNLLEKLRGNYQTMYKTAIWRIYNDPDGKDSSLNYDNCPQISPFGETGAAYRVDGYLEAIENVDLPEAVYDPDVSDTAVVDALAVTRPTEVFDQAYNLHAHLDEIKGKLEAALSDSQVNDAAYKEGRTNYYTLMDAWLAAYQAAEQEMAAALAQIKNITDAYEALWAGTYFLGSYNTSNMYPYLYNTSLVYLSAFDVTGLRDYIRSGGNTATLHNKLVAIARKAEQNEVLVADLIGRIGALDLEMQQLWQNTLVDYAAKAGTPIKNFYVLREEYELDSKWDSLTRNSDDSLAYFNICDIPQVCDILKGETDDVVFLQNAIKEIRGYLDASSVATVPVSNRLYDIYKKATGIKDLYMGSAYTNYGLMTEAQRTDLLNLYANPADADDIYNTMSSIKDKHAGVNYTYPPSQHEGVGQSSPVGEPVPNAGAAGTVALQAPIYHPLATQATSITATLSVWNDGWSHLQTLSGTDSLAGMIDPQADILTMPFTGLEDGREYRIEWNIVHAPYGTALNKTGSHHFTYTAPVGVFSTVDLNKETYDSATVIVTNNSGSELSNQYVFLDGYDENDNLVLSERRSLSSLGTGETTTVDFTFDHVVYTAEVYVAEEDGQKPPVPVRLEVEGGDSTVLVPKSGEAANTTLPFTATVYDQYGEIYEGGVIEWSILPQPEGISIGG
ncbi:MAG TPA: hypothetical protein GX717_10095, partial [Clostridiaceae bacterium]|nr:hypothetical protein [Clostridiaceae bacterium]